MRLLEHRYVFINLWDTYFLCCIHQKYVPCKKKMSVVSSPFYDEFDRQTSKCPSAPVKLSRSRSISPPSSPPSPPPLRRETTKDYRMSPLALPRTIIQDLQDEDDRMKSEFEHVCVFCKRQFYTDASFKTSCPECYDKYRRRCPCGRNIAIDAPKYKTTCTTCWLESRKNTHEPCPTCTGPKALQLRKRKDKAQCLECAKSRENRRSKDSRQSKENRRTDTVTKQENKRNKRS